MKIAIVAPPFGESGGPEIVAKNIAHALKKEGVDVTLFAPGDWKTDVKHVHTLSKSIWNMSAKDKKGKIEELRIKNQMKVVEYADSFDVVHFHCQRYSLYAAAKIKRPCILTFHNNFSKEMVLNAKRAGMHTVAISYAQNKKNLADTVIHHGIPTEKITPSFKKGSYLLFLGRLSDQKGVDIAIEIARRSGKKLYIFGRVGNTEERKKYFEKKIKPFIDNNHVFFRGMISHDEIYKYCANAEALLFPIRRSEAFGLVSIEALACGTPVICTEVAPLTEILKDTRVSFLSNDINELVEAAKNIESFDRKVCRKYAEEKFDSSRMAKEYIALYRKILQEKDLETLEK